MSSSPLSTVPSTPNAPPTEQRGRASVRTPPNANRSMSEDRFVTPRAVRCDMAPLFTEGETAKRAPPPVFERKNAPILFVPVTQIPNQNANTDNPIAQAKGAIPQRFAAAARLGNNTNDHELRNADGVHSMTSTDESDYESVAASEHGSPIARNPTRIRTRRHTPAYQSSSDSRTLRQILTTIGRLEARMDGMTLQIRTQDGPIGLGPNGPTRRTDLPAQSLRKEIDEMAMRVANMSHTLSTRIDMVHVTPLGLTPMREQAKQRLRLC